MDRKKIKILFTNLMYLNRNYGAQGIALPLMDKLNKYFDAEYTFAIPERYFENDILFSREYGFSIVAAEEESGVFLERGFLVAYILYPIFSLLRTRKLKRITKKQKDLYLNLIEKLKESDVVIDLSGIEFVGNCSFLGKWLSYITITYIQRLAEKYSKPYIKYTKSYGPFHGKVYRFLVKRQLNKLPFVFVRGESNLEEVKTLNLNVPTFTFPDISVVLEPAPKSWAIEYISSLGMNPSIPIVGISPSAVISKITSSNSNSSCGSNHIKLCKKLINFFQSKGRQVLLIPHSLEEKNPESCDLELSKKIYNDLENTSNVFIVPDALDYKKVRAIIGLLDFYITGRYHSISSALSMGIPVVPLSWHMKYQDIMSLFLDDFLAIDCRTTGVEEAFSLIEKYYSNRQWFNRDKVLEKKEEIIKQIDESIEILVEELRKYT
uniref:Polysaccharide pyruvyl transferase family protein n=1 Tax=Dictyoglomus turgidum TaxID=513050 RepID=A0A7C3WM86_9BACT